MRFDAALRAMRDEGKRVRRKSWDKGDYVSFSSSKGMVHSSGAQWNPNNLIISMSDDWEVVNEAPAAISVEGNISLLDARIKALEERLSKHEQYRYWSICPQNPYTPQWQPHTGPTCK